MESASCAIPTAHATGDATLYGLLADADNLRLYALAVQRLCHLTKSSERVATLTWTSVDQKNFHKQSQFSEQREPPCLHDWSSRDEIQLLLILGTNLTKNP